jgi:multidrug transporter EmrE-like cation transporter
MVNKVKEIDYPITGKPTDTHFREADELTHVDPQDGGAKAQIMSSLWLIGLSIATSVAAQTLIKISVSQPGSTQLSNFNPFAIILLIFKSPLLIAGLALYGVGALSWIMVLSRLNLSYAYPFLALNFVLIALVSRLVLGESIPLMRWFGILLICGGIIAIASSNTQG